MKIIIFLYYTLFKALYKYSVKKKMMPNGTSLLLTMLLSTNTLMYTFPLKFVIPKGFLLPYDAYVKLFLGSIFFIWYFILKRYFIEKKNYVWIIEKYDIKYKDRIKLIRIMGFIYLILTPISFLFLAIIISRL